MKKYLIAGLGNPGKEYTYTRHNIGFRIIENWLNNLSLTIPDCSCNLNTDKKYQTKIATVAMPNKKIILAEPQTFMNKSGEAIQALMHYHKISLENILIIHDDLSFPLGRFKLSKNAGPAGHNGVKSIIEHLNSLEFIRLRIGIASQLGSCPVNHQSGHNFVLGKFAQEEEKEIENLFKKTVSLLNFFIENDFDKTANNFNNSDY